MYARDEPSPVGGYQRDQVVTDKVPGWRGDGCLQTAAQHSSSLSFTPHSLSLFLILLSPWQLMMLHPPLPFSGLLWSLAPTPLSDQPHRAAAILLLHHSAWAPSSAFHPTTLSHLISLLPGPFFNPDPGLSRIPIFLQDVV